MDGLTLSRCAPLGPRAAAAGILIGALLGQLAADAGWVSQSNPYSGVIGTVGPPTGGTRRVRALPALLHLETR